jgi:hypothetical protein
MATLATKSISAENTFTDSASLEGYFNISISGTFVATVTVQRSYDNSNWFDVDSFTSSTESVGFDPEYSYYRIGVKTGDYTSGTVDVRIGEEDREQH